MNTKRIVLAGGSGFLGRSLAEELLANGYDAVILTRAERTAYGRVRAVQWDGKTLGEWTREIDGAHAVINLAGRSVNCRYTPENRREIIDSRVDSVKVIGRAIAQCARKPKVLIQSASLAIYGDAGARICDESAPPGTGFSVDVCRLWENAFAAAPTPGTRRVLLRIGFVLGPGGGALSMLANLTRFFLGGAVGTGRQSISWIHQHDLNRLILRAIEDENMVGTYNATGPEPVTNADFMRELRHALHRPWAPPTPACIVRAGTWLLETEAELALSGRKCVPKRLVEQRFEFGFPSLREALDDALHHHRWN
jgi:uncharacterized protein (TIGR01777 family)